MTLVAGFFGYVPQAAWFVPAVETAVAASIALAAVAALRTAGKAPLLALTAAIGLLHGLGFSFALRQMLQLDGPHLAVSLGAFNVGVELGQIGFAVGRLGADRVDREPGSALAQAGARVDRLRLHRDRGDVDDPAWHPALHGHDMIACVVV